MALLSTSNYQYFPLSYSYSNLNLITLNFKVILILLLSTLNSIYYFLVNYFLNLMIITITLIYISFQSLIPLSFNQSPHICLIQSNSIINFINLAGTINNLQLNLLYPQNYFYLHPYLNTIA